MLQAVKSDYRQSMTVCLTSVTHRENKQRAFWWEDQYLVWITDIKMSDQLVVDET